MKTSRLKHYFMILLFTALAACSESNNSAPPSVAPSKASIAGTVKDKNTEELLEGVTVKIGSNQVATDAKGYFTINTDGTAAQTVNLSKQGYVPQTINQATPTNTTEVAYTLIKADVVVKKPTNADINVTLPDNIAKIDIPADSLVRADGKPIVGDATVSAATISPASNPKMMPGGYGIVGGGFMESFGALTLNVQDDEGAQLALKNGNKATIRIPASTRGTLEPSMPVFFYDEQQQGWVQQPQPAQRAGSGSRQYFDVEIDRIGSWNIDKAMETVQVKGCVKDSEGKAVANALISADGINYSAITTAWTDASGNFSVPVRENSELYILAQFKELLSNAIKVKTTTNDHQLDDCLIVTSHKNSFTARLTWGVAPRDVDSHLFTPNGKHIYFSRKGSLLYAPYANLDVDDRHSYGPEVVTVRKMMVGTYEYWVRNYSRTHNPGLTESPIRVELAGATGVKVFLPPAGEQADSRDVHLFDVVVDQQCNTTVKTVNTWHKDGNMKPANAPVAVEYCTPAN